MTLLLSAEIVLIGLLAGSAFVVGSWWLLASAIFVAGMVFQPQPPPTLKLTSHNATVYRVLRALWWVLLAGAALGVLTAIFGK
jgi:hypothetical protein